MPNFLEMMRMNNLFGYSPMSIPPIGWDSQDEYSSPFDNVQFGPDFNPYQTPPQTQEPDYDINERMRQYYNPSDEAFNRYNELIGQYPNREDYHPSTLRRIGAMVMSMGQGPKAGKEFFDEPYNEAMEDWKNQLAPAQQAANLERYQNANERQLAYQMAGRDIQNRDLARKTKTDEGNLEIRQQRADVYEWKAKHPGYKQLKTEGGDVILYDPADGSTFDTGRPSGTLTEEKAIEKKGDQAIRAINARGAQTRATKSAGTGTGKALSPNQTKIDEYNRARQLANMPEFKDFIILGDPGTNDFKIKPKTGGVLGTGLWASGPNDEQLNRMGKFIYKDKWNPTTMSPVENIGPQQEIKQPIYQRNKKTGQIRVSTDGGKTWKIQ